MVLSEQCARPATSTRCLDTAAIGRSRTGEPVANVPAPLRDSQLPFSLLEGMHAREQVLWLHDPKYPARTRNPAPLGHSQGNSTVTMMQLRFRAVIALMLAVAGLAQGRRSQMGQAALSEFRTVYVRWRAGRPADHSAVRAHPQFFSAGDAAGSVEYETRSDCALQIEEGVSSLPARGSGGCLLPVGT